ncbi:MAG: CBS domain-containing protein [Burkholderiales bacterium]
MVTLLDEATLIEAATLLHTGTDLVVVCDAAGVLRGVVTKTDVVNRISQCQGAACRTTVASTMTRDVLYCLETDPLDDVWEHMKARSLKNIPAVDAQLRPLGLLRARDVLQVLLDETSEETSLLRDYVMGIGYR